MQSRDLQAEKTQEQDQKQSSPFHVTFQKAINLSCGSILSGKGKESRFFHRFFPNQYSSTAEEATSQFWFVNTAGTTGHVLCKITDKRDSRCLEWRGKTSKVEFGEWIQTKKVWKSQNPGAAAPDYGSGGGKREAKAVELF